MLTNARRSCSLALSLSLARSLTACTVGEVAPGDIGGPDDAAGAATAAAARAFADDVAPLLDDLCAGCHVAQAGAAFLAEDDDRAAVLAWPGLVDLATPPDSRLLSKGPHAGPAWSTDQAATIAAWVELEAVAATESGEAAADLATARVTPVRGRNLISLDPLGRTGSQLEFLLEPIAVGWYLSDISVLGGVGGAYLERPLFVAWTTVDTPIGVDLGDVVVDVEEGERGPVGGGLLVLLGADPAAQLSIHFRAAENARGDGGTLGGGCRAVDDFVASARGRLLADCAGCHDGTDAGATSALDMRNLGVASADDQAIACGQVLGRVNPGDPGQSGIFIAPDSDSGTAHPFKFQTPDELATFRSALAIWIDKEIDP
jgi:hypothetical protein